VTGDVARRLFAARAEADAKRREAQARPDAELAEQEASNRPWAGVPAGYVPDGVLPVSAMLQAAKDAGPRRQSVLEHALANEGGVIEYHPVEQAPE
jgi:hypothetical protein